MTKDEWLSVCSEQVFQYDRQRMMCASVAPIEEREPLLVLLAFNHQIASIPDSVSENTLGEMRLQWWRDTIKAIFDGKIREHPVVLGLAWTIKKYDLSQSLFDEYLEGRSFDVRKAPPETMNELETYIKNTVGAINELMAEVLLIKVKQQTRLAARYAGVVWGLSVLLENAHLFTSKGRFYLPVNLTENERVKVVVNTAEEYLVKVRGFKEYVPDSLLPVMLPVSLADVYLKNLKKNDFDLDITRKKYPRLRKLLSFYWNVVRKRY